MILLQTWSPCLVQTPLGRCLCTCKHAPRPRPGQAREDTGCRPPPRPPPPTEDRSWFAGSSCEWGRPGARPSGTQGPTPGLPLLVWMALILCQKLADPGNASLRSFVCSAHSRSSRGCEHLGAAGERGSQRHGSRQTVILGGLRIAPRLTCSGQPPSARCAWA